MTTTHLIIAAIVAILTASALIAIKISKKKNSDNTIINQSNNKVKGGDIVGGNKTVNK